MTRVCIAGITGWVGRPLAEAIQGTDDLTLVAGIARRAAGRRVSQVHAPETAIPVEETIGPPEARGADVDGSRVHSIRLPGYTIGLEIRFGTADERLTIAYDGGPGAGPYIAGTLLAIRRVTGLTGLVRGLDRLL